MATPISSRLDRMLLAPENPVARIITGRTNFNAKKPTATNTASRITMRSQLSRAADSSRPEANSAPQAPQNTKMPASYSQEQNSATSTAAATPMIAAVDWSKKRPAMSLASENPSSAPVSIMPALRTR